MAYIGIGLQRDGKRDGQASVPPGEAACSKLWHPCPSEMLRFVGTTGMQHPITSDDDCPGGDFERQGHAAQVRAAWLLLPLPLPWCEMSSWLRILLREALPCILLALLGGAGCHLPVAAWLQY